MNHDHLETHLKECNIQDSQNCKPRTEETVIINDNPISTAMAVDVNQIHLEPELIAALGEAETCGVGLKNYAGE